MDNIARLLQSNPFSVHRVRPGALAYKFETHPQHAQSRSSLNELFESLTTNAGWGQIVGPHGTGKTTLLHAIADQWPWHDRKRVWITVQPRLSSQQNAALPKVPRQSVRASQPGRNGPPGQIIIDGYEQLPLRSKLALLLRCKYWGCGLLVTTHKPALWFPILHRTVTSPQTFRDLVECVAENRVPRHVANASIQQANGNIREAFMLLYDFISKR